MPRTKGIHAHPVFKLGKAAVRRDDRNLMFAAILKAPPRVPAEYDFDLKHPGTPTPMFANDTYGDCVIAGRAHQTLRFEKVEQGRLIRITEKDVLKEYFKESGGEDSGLVVLDSLKLWRRRGWSLAKKLYKIRAFAQIDRTDHNEVRRAVFMDLGVGLGLSLPKTAQTQIEAGKPWDVATGPRAVPGTWGGHYVYVPGYTKTGPVCVTWGRKQQMTWRFLDRYCDEAYAIIDAADTAKKKALDGGRIRSFLAALG